MKLKWYMKSKDGKTITFNRYWILWQVIKNQFKPKGYEPR